MDSFRLLSRFGTRLRARHGQGTKRHIKFDDFNASLYCNIKLPGDENWTRVTTKMASDDLKASFHEENSSNQRRLASKLLPGPRVRLQRPLNAPPLSQRSGHRMIAPSALGQAMEEDEDLSSSPPRKRWSPPPNSTQQST